MKRIVKTIILITTIFSLSSCGTSPYNPSSSISSSSISSSKSSSSSSTSSIPDPQKKIKLDHNIEEYIKNNCFAFSSSPYLGEVNCLVIPIWFSDSSSFIKTTCKDLVLDDIESVFNAQGTSLGWYSVSSFFEQESLGKFHLNAVVSDWYSVDKSYIEYSEDSTNTVLLAKTASDWYFSNTGEDRKTFDADGDGYLDSVALIYAAPNYVDTKEYDYGNLWAYTTWIGNEGAKSKSKPGANVLMWASYDFMYGSNVVNDRTGYSDYYFGDTRFTSIDSHTYIHEFSHILGIQDYYDYYDTNYKPGAGFSMQDYAIGAHDPYSTLCWEWSEVYRPLDSTTITIKDFQSSHEMILLANHTVTSVFDEYILLELYTPTLLNKLDAENVDIRGAYTNRPTSPGIRLWHVDSRLLYLTSPSISHFSASKVTTNPKDNRAKYGVYYMMSNSYGGSNASFLGKNYYDYNILQLIRNNTAESYQSKSLLSNNDLFRKNSSFNIDNYKGQFKKETKLNNGVLFPWSFKVLELNSSSATIELTLNK